MKVFIEIFCAFSVGFFFGVAKKIGFWGSFVVSLILSAVSEFLLSFTSERVHMRNKMANVQDQSNSLSGQANGQYLKRKQKNGFILASKKRFNFLV